MNKKVTQGFLLACALLTSGGCSTITQSETQSLALTAAYEGKTVEANCQLRNDKGNWDTKTPSSVTVRKSNEDLEVICKKEGLPDGLLKAISRAAGSMFGNIIFGGAIGAIIDHSKGTGYDYPDQLPVKMGQSVLVDKRDEQQPAQTGEAQPGTPTTPPASPQQKSDTVNLDDLKDLLPPENAK